MRKLKLLFLGICQLTYFFSQAQLLSQEQLEEYKNEDGVFLEHNTDISIEINKEGDPQIKSSYFYKKLMINSRARLYNDESIYDSYINKVSAIKMYQYDLLPNGKYKKIKITSRDTVKPFNSTVFYDDLKSIKIELNNVKENTYTELSYDELLTDYHFFGRESCVSYFPIVKGYIEVQVDNNVQLAFQEHHFEGHEIKFSKREEKNKIILRWEMNNLKSIRPEDGMVSYLSVAPNITFQISSYKKNDQDVQVFSDTNSMYNWYYQKIDTVMQMENDSLRDFTNSLVNDSMSDFEKVKIIYYWVQRNVKYIAIEYGDGGVVPRPPELVYDRRYGDCKDMACLTKKMIGYTGIKANLVWIGTRDIPYDFREVPSPVVTNHMILAYQSDGNLYFLDPTASTLPITYPSYAIQGKEALIEYGKDEYKIVNVPIVESDRSGSVDSCRLEIKGTTLEGDCECRFKGFIASSLRQMISMKTDKDEHDFYSHVLNKGSNKFVLTSYKVHDVDNFDKAIRIEYKFKIDDYIQKFENKYYVNINVAQYLRGNKFDLNTFKYDYEGEFKFIDKEINILKVPDNYIISSTPDSWSLKEKDYNFDISYEIDETLNEIHLDRNIVIDYILYPVDRFTEWNKSVDKLNQNYKNVIVLEKQL